MLNWETSGKNAQDKACWDMEKMVVPDTGGGVPVPGKASPALSTTSLWLHTLPPIIRLIGTAQLGTLIRMKIYEFHCKCAIGYLL